MAQNCVVLGSLLTLKAETVWQGSPRWRCGDLLAPLVSHRHLCISLMNYPIKKAIEDAVWLRCRGVQWGKEVEFRLRVVDFLKPSGEDLADLMDDGASVEGELWLLSIEVVSMMREPMSAYLPEALIRLEDHDSFSFHALNSNMLRRSSTRFGFRFADTTAVQALNPKMRIKGVIAFDLPDDEEAVYSVAIQDGSIQEM